MKKPAFLLSLVTLFVLFMMSFENPQKPKTGAELYEQHCQSCHMKKGKGFFKMYPPLTDSNWVGNDEKIVGNIINGLKGEITVHGKTYDNEMPPMAYLTDEEIAKIINYIRVEIAEVEATISVGRVKEIRAEKK